MDALNVILSIGLLVVCGVLIFLVLSQDTKGGGLAGMLGGGGGGGTFSGRGADSITKLTAYLAGAFFVLIIVIGVFFGKQESTGGLQMGPEEGTGTTTDGAPAPDDAAPATTDAPTTPTDTE